VSDEGAQLDFFQGQFLAQGEQETGVDVVDLDAGEVRFQQLPLDAVLAALTFADLAQLVGVLDKGLGAGGESAAMQVLAPPRTVRPGRDTSRWRSWWRCGWSVRRLISGPACTVGR
jgi:hypothetical protein